MITITPDFQTFLQSRDREWVIKAEIDGKEYGTDSIVDFSIENSLINNQEFEIGTAVISRLVIKLKTYDEIPANAKVVPYLALSTESLTWRDADVTWDNADWPWVGGETEWLPLGTFYVDNRKQERMIWTFECFDGLTFADIAYVSQLDYPTTMQAVWDEVCAQAGLLYDSSVQIDPAHALNAGPAGYTCRQVMSFIAGLHGASVKMSRIGEVNWRTYNADEQPVYEMTEADYIRVKQTNPVKSYTRVVVTYDEDDQLTYEAGEGDDNHTLYLTNPLMTQEMVDSLLSQISGFAYVPIQMDARGYPQLEHGDRISFERSESLSWQDADIAWDDADFAWDGIQTYQSLILRQTFTFRGGLKMAIDAPSVSEQESEFGIDGTLTAAVKRLNENAVRYGKPYYGVTHSRTEGIVVQREDGLAKAVFNADDLSFYAEGQRALWFDVPNRRYKFSGIVEASSFLGGDIEIGSGNNVFKADSRGIWAGHSNYVDAPFYVNMQGQLFATDANISGIITSATINGGSIIGTSIIGATIQTSIGTYPRIELNSGTSVLRAQSSANDSLIIQALYGSSPALVYLTGGTLSGLIQAGAQFIIASPGRDLVLSPGNDLLFGGSLARFNSWSQIFSRANNTTLQAELNAIWSAIYALQSS